MMLLPNLKNNFKRLNYWTLSFELWISPAQNLVRLTVDQTFDLSTLLPIHHAASHDL